jgi:hypothetical protein
MSGEQKMSAIEWPLRLTSGSWLSMLYPVSPLPRACSCAIIFIGLSAVQIANAQQANCKFNVFKFEPTIRIGPVAVNDWGTIVGQAQFLDQPYPYNEAFIRYSGGVVSYYSFPGGFTTNFNARNNLGVTVGESRDSPTGGGYYGFMLQGSTVTPVVDPQGAPDSTRPNGINKYNSIVGTYLDRSGAHRGFKRYSNGSFIKLDYPGAQATYPSAINDNGVVIGTYNNFDYVTHGFIYGNGQWATLDPAPTGISNAGVIVGNNFIYAKNTFTTISVPNSSWTGSMNISPGGLIVGQAGFASDPGSLYGFMASCQYRVVGSHSQP